MGRTSEEIMAEARADTKPRPGCSRHRSHVSGCRACSESFVDRVAWHLAHPHRQEPEPDLPRLDPTPCGVCGCVIGEGLMVMHMAVCSAREAQR